MKQARLKHGVRNQNQPTSLPIINIACKQSANGWYYENFQIKCTKGRRARAHWNLKDALSRLLILMIFWVYFLWILGVSWHHVLIYLYLTTTDSTGENCYHGVTSSPSQRLSIRWEYKRLTKTSLNPENWSILDHVTLNFDLKGAPSHFRPFLFPFQKQAFLDTQVSLAPTHVRPSVRCSVRQSDRPSYFWTFLCNSRLWWHPHPPFCSWLTCCCT